ncbi:MAG: ATP-binding cassette domain-containing protein, partial [Microthrixaceae bacterium]
SGPGSVAAIAPDPAAPAPVRVRGLVASHGPVPAVGPLDLDVRAGEVTAVMGRNGAGKSTLLAVLAGLHRADRGEVAVDGAAPWGRAPRELVRSVGLVPQDPGVLLFRDRVDAECATVDHDAGLPAGATRALLADLAADVRDGTHPRDLSEGQRMALVLAVVLAPGPRVLCLDEPTRGLDYDAKDRLVEHLRGAATAGRAVVVATHDVELVAELADRVVVLADGELVDDGPTREVVCRSPLFAPQVARVLAPQRWLTVAEVEAASA